MDAPENPTYEYQVGGTILKPDVPYVKRQADDALYTSLQEGKFCYVFNCRQMGKSSLKFQMMQRLNAEGFSCKEIDLTGIGTTGVTTQEWYYGLIYELHDIFNLSDQVDCDSWLDQREQLPLVQQLYHYLKDVLLVYVPGEKIVIFIDEIDNVLNLDFDVSDFFALIRACYNQPAFNRLIFVLLGVATPGRLIQDPQKTPFNIGSAIALEGLEFENSGVLAQGLEEKAENPQTVLKEILEWTGGQPFLTQWICELVQKELEVFIEIGKEKTRIEQLIKFYFIQQCKDKNEHFKTIERWFLPDQQKAGRLLGMYQQILEQGGIEADGSPEQMDLQLTGLVVKQGDQLEVYNPIYREVFNRNWLEEKLTQLRPSFYGEAIKAWLVSGKQDESRLLRGLALQDAQEWAKGKSLGDEDYQFLRASEELAKGQVERELEIQKQETRLLEEAKQKLEKANQTLAEANQTLEEAKQEARQKIGIGSAILIFCLVMAAIATATAFTLNKNNGILNTQNSSLKKENQGLNTSNEQLSNNNNRLSQQKKDLEEDIQKAEKEVQIKNEKLRQAETKVKVAFTNQQKAQQLALLAKGNQQKAEQARKQAETDLAQAKNERQIAIQDMEVAKGELRKLNQERQAIGQQLQIEQAKLKQAQEELLMAQNVTKLEQQGLNIARQFELRELDSLLAAIRSGQELKKLGKKQQDWLDYPTLTPLTSLVNITNNIHEKNKLEQHQGWVQKVVFSLDGTMFASSSRSGEIKLWKKDGTLIQTLTGQGYYKIAFNSDGQLLIAASGEREIKIWKLEGENVILQGTINKACNGIFEWSSDGKIIAVPCPNGTGEVWKVEGQLITTFSTDQEGIINQIKFSPDKRTIATYKNRIISFWNWDGATQVRLIKTLNLEDGEWLFGEGMVFHPSEKLIAAIVCKDDKRNEYFSFKCFVKIWRLDGTFVISLPYESFSGKPLSISWGKGLDIVTGNIDGTLTLWTPTSDGKNLGYRNNTLKRHSSKVNSVAVSPDGTLIISGSEDKTIKVWGRNKQEAMFTQTGFINYKHTNLWLSSMDYSSDSQLEAQGQEDGTIKIIKYTDKTVVDTLKGHSKIVLGVSWSPNGQYLVSASADHTVKLWSWNGKKGELIKTFSSAVEGENYSIPISSIVFSPNSETFASGDMVGNIIFWNKNGQLLTLKNAHNTGVKSISFSVDGELIASGDADGTIKLWKKDGTLVRTLKEHTQGIDSIAFSGDRKLIASSSGDRINIWKEGGSIIASFPNFDSIFLNLTFSQDGKSLFVDTGMGSYSQWILNLDDLIARGCLWLQDYLTSHPDEAQDVRQICQNYNPKAKR